VDKEEAEQALGRYVEEMLDTYNSRMAAKLGLKTPDQTLSKELLILMVKSQADFTNTFRALSYIPTRETHSSSSSAAAGTSSSSSSSSSNGNGSSNSSGGAPQTPDLSEPSASTAPEPLESPAAAIFAAVSAGLPEKLVDALTADALMQDPSLIDQWAQWLRVWRLRLQEEGLSDQERMKMQQAASPKFVPRQHLLQYAIEAAESGDFSEVNKLLEICRRPYDEQPDVDDKYSSKPPAEMVRPGVCVLSCSS
jgi:uncharacterized protein YdiU (UPF0061 family)